MVLFARNFAVLGLQSRPVKVNKSLVTASGREQRSSYSTTRAFGCSASAAKAVSLNASRIAKHEGLRASAAQTLVLFIAPLAIAAAVLAPDQPDAVLGGELMALGLGASWVLMATGRVRRGLADDDMRLVAIFDSRQIGRAHV